MNGYYERDDIRKGNEQYFMKWMIIYEIMYLIKKIFIFLDITFYQLKSIS